MPGIEKQTTVNAPAAKVFEYVSDISRCQRSETYR